MFTNRYKNRTLLSASFLILLSACGSESPEKPTSNNSGTASECPPLPKASLSAVQRAGGMESLERYSKWQKKLPSKSCAGSLASLIPDLPDGYGLPPNVRPPIMMEGHVYLKYVEMPKQIGDSALELINFANNPQFEFEIVQLSEEQAIKFKNWFKNNPKSYTDYNVDGRPFYATGGGGWYIPGNKLSGGVGTILKNNVLIKFSMPKMYSDKSVAKPVARLFHTIATKNGL